LGGIVAAVLLVWLGLWMGRRQQRPQTPEVQRLTVRHGTVYSARFAPDGHSVYYSASWDAKPLEIFQGDLNLNNSRSLELPGTQLAGISSTGWLAVLQNATPSFMVTVRGTLGQVPLSGGAPRQIAENVESADWSPDGKELAIVRVVGGKRRLEYPVGHILFETAGWISNPRISPKADSIAFLEHPSQDDDQGMVSVIDMTGQKRVLSSGWESEQGLAWSPKGD
jgi:Tol biopolymer transport system component